MLNPEITECVPAGQSWQILQIFRKDHIFDSCHGYTCEIFLKLLCILEGYATAIQTKFYVSVRNSKNFI